MWPTSAVALVIEKALSKPASAQARVAASSVAERGLEAAEASEVSVHLDSIAGVSSVEYFCGVNAVLPTPTPRITA